MLCVLAVVTFSQSTQEGLSTEIGWGFEGGTMQVEGGPTPRYNHAMAYHGSRTEVVLFGGDGPDGVLGDTWVWNGTRWTQLAPDHSPSPRYGHRMAYIAHSSLIVLFGGQMDHTTHFNDTWYWDGTDWIQVFPDTSPSPRHHHAMAYDTVRSQVVLFGGKANHPMPLDDTWVFEDDQWHQESPPHSPPARWGSAMVFDQARDEALLVYGWLSSGPVDSTWAWNGDDWTQKVPAPPEPEKRGWHALAYDSVNSVVVLFGGSTYSGSMNAFDDTWIWDGVSWSELNPQYKPTGRDYTDMVFDVSSNQMVLFGGARYPVVFNDTWVLTGGEWARPGLIFSDGFESGDISAWASSSS